MDANIIPVIAGIGEIRDRPEDPSLSLDPLDLMAEAMRQADEDARGLMAHTDSIDIVHQTSWAYDDTARALCERLGIAPHRAQYGVTGGESPVRYIHEAAMRIATGQSQVAAVTGAEAQYARARAKKASIALPWPPKAQYVENRLDPRALYNPLALAHQVMAPAEIYPLYENAATHAWGQSPREALAESGSLWASLSAVASGNPFAWLPQAMDAARITMPTADNRLIAWPYTKSMVANPQVNQGAAVIVTSLAMARRAGIPEDRLVYIPGGAFAAEPRDYLARDQYAHSGAQDAVLRRTAALAGAINAVELYSCFPIVPKMARRTLGLPDGVAPSVTGGLSLFGAPLNNYMTHAACAMVRALRAGKAVTGLLYGQGEFVTKHHALLLSREPASRAISQLNVQADADRARGPVPPLMPAYAGPATLETFTVLYDREGAARFGMALARTPAGERTVARIDGADRDSIARLTSLDASPIGSDGVVAAGDLSRWTFG